MFRIGYTIGVFDLFHIGHLNILMNAKSFCDYLIVGVTTDERTLKIKGSLPIIPYNERLQIIESIKYVDKVVPKISSDIKQDWVNLKFDLFMKGSDWEGTVEGEKIETELAKFGVTVKYFPYTKNTSSSVLREVIKEYTNLYNDPKQQ